MKRKKQNSPESAAAGATGGTAVRIRPGPQPAHSKNAIANAAVNLADREGLDAVSMRRVAAEIGTRATSLYRYVNSKQELLDLMVERVMGEDELPNLTGNWRADLHAMAFSMRLLLIRHPWMILVSAAAGPSGLRRLEATLKALDGHKLSAESTMTAVTSLVSFTRGYTAIEIAKQGSLTKSNSETQTLPASSVDFDWSNDFPLFVKIFVKTNSDPPAPQNEFIQCLDCVLDGIELRILRSSAHS